MIHLRWWDPLCTQVSTLVVQSNKKVLTRDDGQPAAQVSKSNGSDVHIIQEDFPFGCFDKAEKRKGKRALAGTCSPKNPDLRIALWVISPIG
jgi:hypothetical protein